MKKLTILSLITASILLISGCNDTIPSGGKAQSGSLYNGTPKVNKTIESAFEGNKASKAQLMLFSDFQCPACQVMHKLLWPKLEKEYIATGKIGMTYKNFPLPQHQNAPGDALASLCALSFGKYKEFGEKMYALEESKRNEDVSDAERVAIAKEIGIPEAPFTQCYSEGWYAKEIEKDMATGDRLGLDHTPSIYLNGKLMDFKSEEEFYGIIDAVLK